MISFRAQNVLGGLLGAASASFFFSVLAYICDLAPFAIKVVLFSVVIILHSRGVPWYGVAFVLVWAGIAYLITKAFSINAIFTIYLSYPTAEDFILSTLAIYVFHDGPINEIADVWRANTVRAVIYFLTSLFLFRGKATYKYCTRHVYEYDPLSTKIFVGSFIAFSIWATLNGNIIYQSFMLRDKVNFYDGKLLELQSRLLHGLKYQVRKYYEDSHRNTIGFEELPAFKYTPIQSGQTRLLLLKRRTIFSGMIDITIHEVPLDGTVEYEAISYTWGDPDPKQGILLGGCRFYVGPNLHRLLHARSSFWKTRLLWVDAICIDQGNNPEKSAQILMMRDIYIRASRVVAWLGDSYDASLAAEMIQHVSSTVGIFDFSPINIYNNYVWQKNSPEWQAFVRIMRNSYFYRAWICQEAALGNKLQFFIGGQYIAATILSTAMLAIAQPEVRALFFLEGDTESQQLDFYDNWVLMYSLRLLGPNHQLPLGYLLSASSRLKATKDVDKIYAMLGLSNSEVSQTIIPNYDSLASDLFIDVASKLLESEDDAPYLLPHAGIGHLGRFEGLPSWVPDWQNESERQGVILSVDALPFFEALGDIFPDNRAAANMRYRTSGRSQPSFLVNRQQNTLSLKGFQFDTISQLSSSFDVRRRDRQYLSNWHREIQELVNTGSRTNVSQSEPPINTEALWRTLIANRSQEWPAPPQYGNFYKVWERCSELGDVWPPSSEELDILKRLADPNYRENRHNLDAAYPILTAFLLYGIRLKEACAGRRFCVTGNGDLALVPREAKAGDVICVILGMQVPYILRHCERESEGIHDEDWGSDADSVDRKFDDEEHVFRLVGESYVHGAMDGEKMVESSSQTFTII